MASAIQAIADALTTALNGETWSAAFTAVRSWRKSYDLPDLATIKVTVSPRSRLNERETRAYDVNRHTLDVSFMKRVSATPATRETEIDALAALAEEVADFLSRRNLTVSADVCQPLAVEIDPVCDPATLDALGVFTSVVSVAYRERRAVP